MNLLNAASEAASLRPACLPKSLQHPNRGVQTRGLHVAEPNEQIVRTNKRQRETYTLRITATLFVIFFIFLRYIGWAFNNECH